MKTRKIYTVTDLGPGDGGKGGVVHKLTTMMHPHTLVKVGGAQGSHGVRTGRGEQFSFSQWGCGTFEGTRTHLSSRMIISPEGILNEADALRYGGFGIQDPFSFLTIDQEALCATSFHGIASRLKEMARGTNPRGTIGTGVGEAYRYSSQYPDLVVRARDLSRADLKDVLAAVREQVRLNLDSIMKGEFLPSDREAVEREVVRLHDDDFLDYIANRFREVSRLATIVDHDYLRRNILAQDGVVVVESSHGVLTDQLYGFHPHTSAIRTLPCFTHAMFRDAGYDGEFANLGVFRAYAIRHGAGPLPTADPKMAEDLLPGSHKDENRYQGQVRVGPLDLVLLRYAIEVCGGPSAFQGLAISWFDQIITNGTWYICDRYRGVHDPAYFVGPSIIRVGQGGMNDEQLSYQENLGKQISGCKPEITALSIPSLGQDELYSFCANVLEERLGIPVRMISFGSTERDKVCK